MIKPDDLNRKQREHFDIWRELGLSEEAALAALREDGLIQESDHDQLVANFVNLGLSGSAAEIAANGRDGPHRRPASRAVSSDAVTNYQRENEMLVAKVRELAQSL